jgi:hypothetical protein
VNTDEPLDELYFKWLYSQVGSVRIKNTSRTHWKLLRQLYTKEFVWIIPNDDNRAEDGRDLRYEFIEKEELDYVDPNWLDLGCSMLEMLIGLSRRLAFESEGKPSDWFWHLLKNLKLNDYTDDSDLPYDKVDDTLNRIIWRTYSRTGNGGLFPLRKPNKDQRDVEIWYQLCAYLLERE